MFNQPLAKSAIGKQVQLAKVAKWIDGKQFDAPSLDLTEVGRLMAQLSTSPVERATAIAALRLAFDAPAQDSFYDEVMRNMGGAARAYAEALAPGLPELLVAFVNSNAAAGDDRRRRALAYDALMAAVKAVAYPAPSHPEYRRLMGCAPNGRGGLPMSKMPVAGLVYCQVLSIWAPVAMRCAAKLSPSDLRLGAPDGNGAFLVWSAHVRQVAEHARHVGGLVVDVSRIGKSSSGAVLQAGKRVDAHSFEFIDGAWSLDAAAKSVVFTGWAGVRGAVVDYCQRYILVGPPGNSEPGELFVGRIIGADPLSGLPFANVSPCGAPNRTPYFADPQGDRVVNPGQAAAIADAIGSLGGLPAAFAAPADGAAVHRVADPMLRHQLDALLALLGGGRTDAATACEAAARRAAAARAGAPIPGADAPVACLSMLGAGFVIMGSTVFDVVPSGVFQVHPLVARVGRRWVVARGAG